VEGVTRLRIGKAIEVDLEAPNQAEAQARLDLLGDRLLANPVIENWSVDLAEIAGGVEP
jgi:phosphoribosylformylglycinamidine synthase